MALTCGAVRKLATTLSQAKDVSSFRWVYLHIVSLFVRDEGHARDAAQLAMLQQRVLRLTDGREMKSRHKVKQQKHTHTY